MIGPFTIVGPVKRRTVALLVLGLVAAGCSGGVDGPVIEGNRSAGGTDAEVFGEVVIEGRCLYLFMADADTRFPVVWPNGTRWDADESLVVLPSGTVVHEGDRVSGGGGYHGSATLGRYTVEAGVALAESCVDNQYGEVAVFNSNGDIEVSP